MDLPHYIASLITENPNAFRNDWHIEVRVTLEDLIDPSLGPHPFYTEFTIGGIRQIGDYQKGEHDWWEWEIADISAEPYDEDGEPLTFNTTPEFQDKIEAAIRKRLSNNDIHDILDRKVQDDAS